MIKKNDRSKDILLLRVLALGISVILRAMRGLRLRDKPYRGEAGALQTCFRSSEGAQPQTTVPTLHTSESAAQQKVPSTLWPRHEV